MCDGFGGHLPSYHSQADIDFVLNKLIGDRSRGNCIWSGLYWSDTLHSQAWLDRTEFDVYQWATVPEFFQEPQKSDKPTDDNRWTLCHYWYTGKHYTMHRNYLERVVCRMNLTNPDVCPKMMSSKALERLDPHEVNWICKNLVLPTTTTTTTTTPAPTTPSTTTTTQSRRMMIQWDGKCCHNVFLSLTVLSIFFSGCLHLSTLSQMLSVWMRREITFWQVFLLPSIIFH